MRTLREAIEALQRELPPGKTAASATFQCVALEKGGSLTFGVLTSADIPAGFPHYVTVQIDPAAGRDENGTIAIAPSVPAPPTDKLAYLSQMFGTPGFDNAARASVFREIFDELSPTQAQALLEDLRRDKTEVPVERHPDSTVAMARIRLLRLLKLGPAGLSGGVDAMLRAFESESIGQVLGVIQAHWKTQSDWVDTTPPGVKLQ
jgi:hypothetical protein